MHSSASETEQARRDWMGVLARCSSASLAQLWQQTGQAPAFEWLRRPEVGGVMLRGRMGGTGAPFNLGEMSVTRCALSLNEGPVGHGYVQGRDKAHAEIAALVDALMQTDAAAQLEAQILEPLRAEMAATKEARSAKAAATKVDFFTLVRGED